MKVQSEKAPVVALKNVKFIVNIDTDVHQCKNWRPLELDTNYLELANFVGISWAERRGKSWKVTPDIYLHSDMN